MAAVAHALGIRAAAALLAAVLALPGQARGGEREVLGFGYAIANDSIGQLRDRWQSSFVTGSLFLGPGGADPLALPPGRLLEFRLSHQVVTPESLDAPARSDRPFGAAFTVELLTHGRLGDLETSLGAGLAVTGPQTRSFRFQRWLHERLGYPLPRTEGREIGDAVHPVLSAEFGRSFGGSPRVRPFVEARAGLETLLRGGVDLTWGRLGTRRVRVRDPVTGQRAPTLWGPREEGLSLTLGADAAAVLDSAFLPAPDFTPKDRLRVRAGLAWQGARWSVFYGATWLSPEFAGQREGQVVGLLQIGARF